MDILTTIALATLNRFYRPLFPSKIKWTATRSREVTEKETEERDAAELRYWPDWRWYSCITELDPPTASTMFVVTSTYHTPITNRLQKTTIAVRPPLRYGPRLRWYL